jgi:hypothetical protein
MRVRSFAAPAVCVLLAMTALAIAACGPEKEMWSQRSSWEASETPTAAATAPAAATPTAAPVKLFDLGNVYGVTAGAKAPTFTFDNDATVTEIMDYHYIVGGGPTPGTIALKRDDGTVFGPWQTVGLDGQGNVKNAYWDAKPNAQIPAGTYTVVDSDPGTWSTNEQANGLGFVTILGTFSAQ